MDPFDKCFWIYSTATNKFSIQNRNFVAVKRYDSCESSTYIILVNYNVILLVK